MWEGDDCTIFKHLQLLPSLELYLHTLSFAIQKAQRRDQFAAVVNGIWLWFFFLFQWSLNKILELKMMFCMPSYTILSTSSRWIFFFLFSFLAMSASHLWPRSICMLLLQSLLQQQQLNLRCFICFCPHIMLLVFLGLSETFCLFHREKMLCWCKK